MLPLYANIIIDISHEKLDKTFQYRVPEALLDLIQAGSLVAVPFGNGNRLIKGYVVELSDTPIFAPEKTKLIDHVVLEGVPIESQLIRLASWMREQYGATMNQALKTVIPVKRLVKNKEKRYLKRLISTQQVQELLLVYGEKKNMKARVRLLTAFIEDEILPFDVITDKLNISQSTIRTFIDSAQMEILTESIYRNPIHIQKTDGALIELNQPQQFIVDDIVKRYRDQKREPSLIHGVTGSGKTEVYLGIIEHMIADNKQVIVLIPEIALTYQTVMRFYKRFGDRVSIINSKLSQGERYDQFLKAKRGELDIMIGPRSALFTPFERLGCIIIDEEHETSYKSETSPRYHARETAIQRASLCNACVILGTATPSMESYSRALKGEYLLYKLKTRAREGSELAAVHIVDLRQELQEGNKSVFSRQLKELIEDRLAKKQQIMLFLNRRGFAGFVSCRACGEAMKCPHCEVSLTYHQNGTLVCHYCGHTISMPKNCPSCGSVYLAAFGIGTQKVETMVQNEFPGAKVLRMDFDTTRLKGGHEKILSAYANGEADILIGTQMIVKGHDFPNVTLVGVLAADLSLYSGDFHASERTFQLLTQAVGRAGRSSLKGDAVIQTYQPEHYSIVTAANQDYENFYHQEMLYRNLLGYPPVYDMLTVHMFSKSEENAKKSAQLIGNYVENLYDKESPPHLRSAESEEGLQKIGPVDAPVSKAKDVYHQVIHLKHKDHETLIHIKHKIEELMNEAPAGNTSMAIRPTNKEKELLKKITVQFEFN